MNWCLTALWKQRLFNLKSPSGTISLVQSTGTELSKAVFSSQPLVLLHKPFVGVNQWPQNLTKFWTISLIIIKKKKKYFAAVQNTLAFELWLHKAHADISFPNAGSITTVQRGKSSYFGSQFGKQQIIHLSKTEKESSCAEAAGIRFLLCFSNTQFKKVLAHH